MFYLRLFCIEIHVEDACSEISLIDAPLLTAPLNPRVTDPVTELKPLA